MHKWTIVAEGGHLQLLCRNLQTGEGHCCGHGAERPELLRDMLGFIANPGTCRPGDVVVLPDGQVLQFALFEGQA